MFQFTVKYNIYNKLPYLLQYQAVFVAHGLPIYIFITFTDGVIDVNYVHKLISVAFIHV